MLFKLPKTSIGHEIRSPPMRLFPVFGDIEFEPVYATLKEAIPSAGVQVREVSSGATISELNLCNVGTQRVLCLEGEELVGVKQNRIANVTCLIPRLTTVRLPVSCVKRGRWSKIARDLRSLGLRIPIGLRFMLRRTISRSMYLGRGNESNQAMIWAMVDQYLRAYGVNSLTDSISDLPRQRRARVQFQSPSYVTGATGVVIGIDHKTIAVELFAFASTCETFWLGLLQGAMLDANTQFRSQLPNLGDAKEMVAKLGNAYWRRADVPGEGEAYRASTADMDATLLTFRGSFVHASAIHASANARALFGSVRVGSPNSDSENPSGQ